MGFGEIQYEGNVEALMEERIKERKQVLLMYSQSQFSQAIFRCRRLISISKKIYEITNKSKNDLYMRNFFEYVADHLFLAKCHLKCDKIQNTRDSLLYILPLVTASLNEKKLEFQKVSFKKKNIFELF